MPLPLWTTSRCPAESHAIPRGLVRPPATLTAFQPEPTEPAYRAAVTPVQEAGNALGLLKTAAVASCPTLRIAQAMIESCMLEAIGLRQARREGSQRYYLQKPANAIVAAKLCHRRTFSSLCWRLWSGSRKAQCEMPNLTVIVGLAQTGSLPVCNQPAAY